MYLKLSRQHHQPLPLPPREEKPLPSLIWRTKLSRELGVIESRPRPAELRALRVRVVLAERNSLVLDQWLPRGLHRKDYLPVARVSRWRSKLLKAVQQQE